MKAITVVLPTLTARRERLRKTLAAYARTTPGCRFVTVENRPTCGEAWDIGARMLDGAYLHFGADDLEPHAGWWEPLVEAVDAGMNPCPVVLAPDGKVESCGAIGWNLQTELRPDWAPVEWSPVPFLSARHWQIVGHVPHELHYCTDTWVSARLARAGIPTVVRDSSRFTHHNAPAGRGAGMDIHARNLFDRAAYAAMAA